MAMIMIMLSHIAARGDVYNGGIQEYFALIICNFGQLGNCIFLVCSFYFLIEEKAFKEEKLLKLITDVTFFAWFSGLAYICISNYMYISPYFFGNTLVCYSIPFILYYTSIYKHYIKRVITTKTIKNLYNYIYYVMLYTIIFKKWFLLYSHNIMVRNILHCCIW